MIKSRDIKDYFQAKLIRLRPEKQITFDVFLFFRENNHIMGWQRRGELLTTNFFERYRDRGIKNVWIHHDDAEAFRLYLSPEERAEHAKDVAELAAEAKTGAAANGTRESSEAKPKAAPAAASDAVDPESAASAAAEAEYAKARAATGAATTDEAADGAAADGGEGDARKKKGAAGGRGEESVLTEKHPGGAERADSDSDDEEDLDALLAAAGDDEDGAQTIDARGKRKKKDEGDGAGDIDGEGDRRKQEADGSGGDDVAAAADGGLAGVIGDEAANEGLDGLTVEAGAEAAPDEIEVKPAASAEAVDEDVGSTREDDAWESDGVDDEAAGDWGGKKAPKRELDPVERAKRDETTKNQRMFADDKANERLAKALQKAREKRKAEAGIKSEAGKKLWDLLNDSKLTEKEKKEAVAGTARDLLARTAQDGKSNPAAAQATARRAVADVLKDALKEKDSLLAELWEMADLDPDLGHGANVATYASILAMAFGRIDQGLIADLALAGLLHDIGISQIPAGMSRKPWKTFTPPEHKAYAQHVETSLALANKHGTGGKITERVQTVMGQHHEKFDGSGYPQRLQGFKVDDVAQLLAIADLLESISMGRWDGAERSLEDTMDVIENLEKARTFPEHFNPDVFAAVLRWVKQPATDETKQSAMSVLKDQTKGLLKAA